MPIPTKGTKQERLSELIRHHVKSGKFSSQEQAIAVAHKQLGVSKAVLPPQGPDRPLIIGGDFESRGTAETSTDLREADQGGAQKSAGVTQDTPGMIAIPDDLGEPKERREQAIREDEMDLKKDMGKSLWIGADCFDSVPFI